jgi:hypothetical protein
VTVWALRGAALLLVMALAASCGPATRAPRLADDGVAPWVVPPSAFGTQRLFRGSYQGPEGDGGFRATLRLAAEDRFQLVLADRLGRTVASLQVDGDRQQWVDHRRERYCLQPAAFTLPGGGELPVLPAEVPALLLGRVPGSPAAPSSAGAGPSLAYGDGHGRRWTAELAAGRPVRWALHDAAGPSWWWRRDDGGGVLAEREGRQLRWQEVVVEPLPAPPPPADIPAGFEEECVAGPPLAGIDVG